MKKFIRKSRVRIPLTTPSPEEITRQKEVEELLDILEKLKKKKDGEFITLYSFIKN